MSAMAMKQSILVLAFALVCTGCGSKGDRPELGAVKGKVTIDGKPLGGAIVVFMPDSGRPATGMTDAEGNYELEYLHGAKGTKVGPNTIGFAVPTGGSTSAPIPQKYQNRSDIKVDVKPGSNTFDFDLKADAASAPASAKNKPVID